MAAALKLPKDFHKQMAALVRELESYGWVGRLSTPGHAIMQAPDGVTTCSITPKLGSPRHLANNRAKIDRWLREQVATEPASEPAPAVEWLPWPVMPPKPLTAPELVAEPVEPDELDHLCEECLRGFRTLQALSVHVVRAHVRVNCPVCRRPFSPGNLPRHHAVHVREFPTHDDAMRAVLEARAELARMRDELATWQALAEETEASLVNTLGGSHTR